MRRIVSLACLLSIAATAVPAAETTGKIASIDRVKFVMVMDDKMVWSLGQKGLVIPDDLTPGVKVRIAYEMQGDSGVTKIYSLTKVAGS
jgi:hypothetical protein